MKESIQDISVSFIRTGKDKEFENSGKDLVYDGNVLKDRYRSVCAVFSNIKCDNGYEVRIEEKNDGLMSLSSIGVIILNKRWLSIMSEWIGYGRCGDD